MNLAQSVGDNNKPATLCETIKVVRKRLIKKEIVVEATGVELITMLTARKLLILGSATSAKKAPLPDPLYVCCTKILSLWSPANTTQCAHYPIDSPD